MTTDSRAQIIRIAHLLEVDNSELDFLEGMDSGALRELHSQIVEVLFDTTDIKLGSLQAAAKILPPAITAKVAEKALGPVLCGRIAGSVDPPLAVSIAKRLPSEFLADVARHVHPNQIEAIISQLPISQVDRAATVLVERGDLVALGHFSGIVKDPTLKNVISSLDGSGLLDVAPFIEPKERISHLLALIDDSRLLDILRCADRDDRWVDAFDLVDRLDVSVRKRIATLVVPEIDLIGSALRAAIELDQWSSMLSFAIYATDVPQDSWSQIEGFRDKKLIAEAMASVDRNDLWDELSMLVSLWPDDLRKTFSKSIKARQRSRIGL